MSRICKGMKRGEEDMVFREEITSVFCEAKGEKISINLETDEEFNRLKENFRMIFKTSSGISMDFENIFFKSKLPMEASEYNFAFVQSQDGLNHLGVSFLENRIIKIDNGKARIKILRKPDSKVFLLSQRIVVIVKKINFGCRKKVEIPALRTSEAPSNLDCSYS